MKTLLVNIAVSHFTREDFIIHTFLMVANTVSEPGCISYNVFVNENNYCEFTFIEVFENDEAFEYHKTTEHFKKWKEFTQDMIISKDVKFIKKL